MGHYQQAKFLLSVADLQQLPADQGIEVAFVGRSNAGKSSVLNALVQNKNLARVSKTPGRTQLLNFFILDATRRLVDLPGYGFARVPQAIKDRWVNTLESYLQHRASLQGLVLVMDIRHPMQALDLCILELSCTSKLPLHIVLNKADKLSHHQVKQTEREVQRLLVPYGGLVSWQVFSALKREGLAALQVALDTWFDFKRK